MSKKGAIETNNMRLRLSEKYAKKRAMLKLKLKDRTLSMKERLGLQYKLRSLPLNSNKSRYRRRCMLGGTPRSVSGFLNLNRMFARELIRDALLPGIRKSCW